MQCELDITVFCKTLWQKVEIAVFNQQRHEEKPQMKLHIILLDSLIFKDSIISPETLSQLTYYTNVLVILSLMLKVHFTQFYVISYNFQKQKDVIRQI